MGREASCVTTHVLSAPAGAAIGGERTTVLGERDLSSGSLPKELLQRHTCLSCDCAASHCCARGRCTDAALDGLAPLADQERTEATGPGGHLGTTRKSSVTDLTPDVGSWDKPFPDPPRPSLEQRSQPVPPRRRVEYTTITITITLDRPDSPRASPRCCRWRPRLRRTCRLSHRRRRPGRRARWPGGRPCPDPVSLGQHLVWRGQHDDCRNNGNRADDERHAYVEGFDEFAGGERR